MQTVWRVLQVLFRVLGEVEWAIPKLVSIVIQGMFGQFAALTIHRILCRVVPTAPHYHF